MPAREREERLIIAAPGEIRAQNMLNRARAILDLHVPVELARHARFWTEAATDKDVEPFNRILAGFADRHAARNHADVTNVVLRAGMRATREMDVDRTVERDPGL